MSEPDFEAIAMNALDDPSSCVTETVKALRTAYQAGMIDGMESSVKDIEADLHTYPNAAQAEAVSRAAYRAVMRIKARAAGMEG